MADQTSSPTETGPTGDEQLNVVITGFGPFRDHQENPSWEAIKDDDKFFVDRPNIRLVKRQVSVTYDEVDEVVASLWKTHNPLLMVHVGLAAHETAIRLEETARHGPFIHDDVARNAPHKDLRVYEESSLEEDTVRHNYSCRPCSFDSSKTCFDIDSLCTRLNQKGTRLVFKRSCDAGLYVCEYIFQKSLSICPRTAFIHIPDTKDFELADIRDSLKLALESLIDEALKLTQNPASQ